MKNIGELMLKAQKVQSQMSILQTKMEGMTFDGQSGNGLVKITLNGRSEMKKISIDKSLAVADEVDVLEDLILAAYNDAHAKIELMQEEGMKEATGGVGLGGLKLPF